MSKKKIVIFIVGVILVMTLIVALPSKIKLSSIKNSKIDYFIPELDYTYKVDVPQLKGSEEKTALFNASVFRTYDDFIRYSVEYELKENAINKLMDVETIEDSEIIFLIIKMNNQGNDLIKVLYFDKNIKEEITNETYIEKLLYDDKNVEVVKEIRSLDDQTSNLRDIYTYKEKKGHYKRIITYEENDKMKYTIKEIKNK